MRLEKKQMVIDLFTAFNEKIQVLARLKELESVVDFHVICESAFTQRRNPKPYYFNEWLKEPEFEPYLDKILRVKVDEKEEGGGNFGHDIFQRNQLVRIFDKLSPASTDLVNISDADEIFSAEAFKARAHTLPKDSFLTFQMGYYCYYLNLRVLDQNRNNFRWNGTVLTTADMYTKFTPHQIIKFRDYVINQPDGENVVGVESGLTPGWHCSYLSKEICYNKYFATCEPFDPNSIPPQEIFDNVWKESARPDGNFIFCDDLSKKHLPLQLVDMESLPKYFQDNQDKYKDIIWKE